MNRPGKAWVVLVGIIVGILVVLLLIGTSVFSWYTGNYNRVVRLDESVKQSWSDVEAQLQRRFELVPNLVATVKGYADHEKDLFENIAKSRENYFQGKSPQDKMAASNQMSGLLSRLLVLQERYPDLKANQGFRDLQAQLEGTENRIAVARTRYNAIVRELNSYRRSFFGGYFADKTDVTAASPFEASEQAKIEVPKVEF
jgi:LemA protein